MTMSPIYGIAGGNFSAVFLPDFPAFWGPAGAAGNDSTLVAASLPRQSRLSVLIAESWLSTIASSAGAVEAALAAAKTAFRTIDWAVRCLRQWAERTAISSVTGSAGFRPRRGADLRRLFRALVNPRLRAVAPRRPCRRPRRSWPPARDERRPQR